MANAYFKFKQFTIWHDKCAMKVGTDGVLLGAWSNVANAAQILDIGTGTALVALMAAQRSTGNILAVEIDEAAVAQARENVAASPWSKRVSVEQCDFNSYNTHLRFDAILSNPPFFVESLTSPNELRTQARHNNSLTFNNLLCRAAHLLTPNGHLSLVLPTDTFSKVEEYAALHGLHPARLLHIVTTPGKQPKRTLVEFRLGSPPHIQVEELLIEVARHTYSPEYIALTQPYYLHM